MLALVGEERLVVGVPAVVPEEPGPACGRFQDEPAEPIRESSPGRSCSDGPDLLLRLRAVDHVAINRDVIPFRHDIALLCVAAMILSGIYGGFFLAAATAGIYLVVALLLAISGIACSRAQWRFSER